MNSKTKLTLSITAMVAVTLLAIVGIMAAFAATQQTFSTSITVVYKSTDVEGTATAQWKLGTSYDGQYYSFYGDWNDMVSSSATGSQKELDLSAKGPLSLTPQEPIDLSDENPGVVLKYTFTNSAEHPYTLNFKYQATNATKNINAVYSASSQEMDDGSLGDINNNFTNTLETIVPGGASENIYIVLKIDDWGTDSVFDGTFNIDLNGLPSDYDLDYVCLSDGNDVMLTGMMDQNATTLDTTGLTYKDVPVTKIGASAFQGNTNLETVVLNDVKEIGANAFKGCTGITSLSIGESVTNFEDAFSGLTNLTTLNYNAKSATIGSTSNGLFYNAGRENTGINVTFGEEVIDIPGALFSIHWGSDTWGPKITNLDLGTSVENIGGGAFRDCTEITGTLTIPNSVKTIGGSAFYGCRGISQLIIGSGVLEIDTEFQTPFCSIDLERILVNANNERYTSQDMEGSECSVIIDKRTNTLLVGCKNSTIPNDGSVTIIGNSAFSYSGLTELTIPDTIIEIGDGAFDNCSSLTGTIEIPNSVKNIHNAFSRSGISGIVLGMGISMIEPLAFCDCENLKSVTILGCLNNIGFNAFLIQGSGKVTIENITIENEEMCEKLVSTEGVGYLVGRLKTDGIIKAKFKIKDLLNQELLPFSATFSESDAPIDGYWVYTKTSD